jgi:hypothetical protein
VAEAFAVIVMLLMMSLTCLAQQSGTGIGSIGSGVDPEVARIRDEQRREMQLRNIEAKAGHTNEKTISAAIDQLSQDFKRIQNIRNEIVHALKDESALDYKRIYGQTAELKKRALRMQTYLALRSLDAQGSTPAGQVEYDDKQIKDALVKLCKRIDSFVANPKFTSPLVVDIGGTAKARRDLEEIIGLSESVKSSAERLSHKSR